jgi:hypothetical protein
MLAVVACLSIVGCAASPAKPVAVAVPAADQQADARALNLLPVEGATPQDAVVRIVGDVTCTGTMIADDLVLTAHHCVVKHDAQGHAQAADVDASSLAIELGSGSLPWGEVKVRALVTPDCGYTTPEGDIAILVLARKVIGITPYTPVTTAPKKGESLQLVGFGRCVAGSEVRRNDRNGIQVDSLTSTTFDGEAQVCPGDSGGPVFRGPRDNGELIGVVSAAAMDEKAETFKHARFSRLDAWPQLFSAAREIADGASPSELPPYRACK